jgi:hypothetical protein
MWSDQLDQLGTVDVTKRAGWGGGGGRVHAAFYVQWRRWLFVEISRVSVTSAWRGGQARLEAVEEEVRPTSTAG